MELGVTSFLFYFPLNESLLQNTHRYSSILWVINTLRLLEMSFPFHLIRRELEVGECTLGRAAPRGRSEPVCSAIVYFLLTITGCTGWGLYLLHLLMTPITGHFPYFLSGVELKPNLPAGLKLPGSTSFPNVCSQLGALDLGIP